MSYSETPVANCCHNDAECNDNDACTTDTCENNQCVHTPVVCNDSDPCTVDTCDPATGCVHTEIAGCCRNDSECPPSRQAPNHLSLTSLSKEVPNTAQIISPGRNFFIDPALRGEYTLPNPLFPYPEGAGAS